MRSWGHQGQAAPESLPSAQGWQLRAWWALGGAEGPPRPSIPASSLTGGVGTQRPPSHPCTEALSWAGWLGALAAPRPHASFLPGPHAGPPLRAPHRPRVGSSRARSTMWLLVPQPGRASWNWPVSCLGCGALSKVNKQIRRS